LKRRTFHCVARSIRISVVAFIVPPRTAAARWADNRSPSNSDYRWPPVPGGKVDMQLAGRVRASLTQSTAPGSGGWNRRSLGCLLRSPEPPEKQQVASRARPRSRCHNSHADPDVRCCWPGSCQLGRRRSQPRVRRSQGPPACGQVLPSVRRRRRPRPPGLNELPPRATPLRPAWWRALRSPRTGRRPGIPARRRPR